MADALLTLVLLAAAIWVGYFAYQRRNRRPPAPKLVQCTRKTDPVPGEALKCLDRLSLANPLSRILFYGTVELPEATASDETEESAAEGAVADEEWQAEAFRATWAGLDHLLLDPSASALRHMLSSVLGLRIEDPDAEPERVQGVLACLDQIEAAVSEHESSALDEAWEVFVADVLWATLADVGADPQHRDLIWSRWTAGFPGHRSLAQRCGRIASHAEATSRSLPMSRWPKLVWRWRDIAKAVLPRWLGEGEGADYCLGLWLEGYLPETGVAVPRLKIARRAVDQSIHQIVRSWLDNVAKPGDEELEAPSGLDTLMALITKRDSYQAIEAEARDLMIRVPPDGDADELFESWEEDLGPLGRIQRYVRTPDDSRPDA